MMYLACCYPFPGPLAHGLLGVLAGAGFSVPGGRVIASGLVPRSRFLGPLRTMILGDNFSGPLGMDELKDVLLDGNGTVDRAGKDIRGQPPEMFKLG